MASRGIENQVIHDDAADALRARMCGATDNRAAQLSLALTLSP
jgi:hypothetical protein